MNLKKLFLLLIITLLLVGLSYATEVSNDTTSHTGTITTKKVAEPNGNTPIKEKDNKMSTQKAITKQSNTKSVKTESNAIDVNDFNTLHNTLTRNTYDTLTLNIKSDIKLKKNTEVNGAIKTLTINGNGKTINGGNKYQFLYILPDTNVTIKNTKIINCYAYEGGAIYNKGTLTITDSILNNNTAMGDMMCGNGGGIYNYNSTSTIINTTLNNNEGSAICNLYGTSTIINTTLNNNAAELGGAISNYDTTVTITNSTLNNNTAGRSCIDGCFGSGGAIYNWYVNITITNTTLNNNKVEYGNGGAIDHQYGTLIIMNSTFNNNKATNNFENDTSGSGGAINSEVNVTIIKNCEFNNNTSDFGGGVCLEANMTTIQNSIFKNNNAKSAAAIYSIEGRRIFYIQEKISETEIVYHIKCVYYGQYMRILNNTFEQNRANDTGKAIINNCTKTTLKNNIHADTSMDSSTIYITGRNATLENNIFLDGRNDTKISMNKIANTPYTHNAMIKGTLKTTTGTPLKTDIILDINGKKYAAKTDSTGTFIYKYKTTKLGTNNVTLTFVGNNKNYETTAKTKFEVTPTTTKITINKIADTQYTNNATIKGTLKTTSGTIIKSATLTVSINSKKYTTKTNSEGIFTLKYTTNTLGKNNITAAFTGNTEYKSSTAKTTFTVTPITTKITIIRIANTQYTNNAIIKGTLKTSSGTVLKYVKLTVNVNGKKYTTKTNSNGVFTLKYTTKTPGKNNVTVAYAGNTKYSKATAKTTFKVTPKTTKITITKIAKTKLGKTVIIIGLFTDKTGNKLKYAKLTVKVNGKKYTLKTNKAGKYALKYKTTTTGTNKITVTYTATSKYAKSTATRTFAVVK